MQLSSKVSYNQLLYQTEKTFEMCTVALCVRLWSITPVVLLISMNSLDNEQDGIL